MRAGYLKFRAAKPIQRLTLDSFIAIHKFDRWIKPLITEPHAHRTLIPDST
jgi:hypothetical protein